jgi:hypothetical protein
MVVACVEIMLQPVAPRTTAAPSARDASRRAAVRLFEITDPPGTDDGIVSDSRVSPTRVPTGAVTGRRPRWRTLAYVACGILEVAEGT